MIPVAINKHFFTAPDGGEVGVCARTVEACAKQMTGDGQGYTYTRTETLPYEHALMAAGVAAALGADWIAEPQSDEYPGCNWNLRREGDGLTLYLSGPSYDHRTAYAFGLSAPRYEGSYVQAYDTNNDRLNSPSIRCGLMKTPAQMAKDIVRRLIPDAEKVYVAVLARIASMQASANAQLESWKLMHAAFGMPAPDRNNRNSNYWSGSFDSGSFEVHSGGSVTFKLHSLSAPAAVRLAKAIRGLGLRE